jgi:aminomethyltransferase
MKNTPLHDGHIAAGAKMADFAGWNMPIHYGSQIEEHHAVRRDAGMFDVSHMRAIDIAGSSTQAWLRKLLANDVAKLTLRGKALYSCMLNPEGGVIDDLIVYFFSPEQYRIVANAGTADKDLAWMRKQAEGCAVLITDRPELAMIAIQGPNARARFWAAFPQAQATSESLVVFQAAKWGDWLIARTGYTGEDGFEITLPAAQAANVWDKLRTAGIVPVGLGARDTLRLEAGMNLYGADMDETTLPTESGLGWTIDLADANRNFIGKAALLVRPPQKQWAGLLLEDRGILRSHQKIITKQEIGEITSGTFSPTLQRSIALARLPLAASIGDEVTVIVRDKLLKARVVKPAFVRHGKALI